MTTKPWLRSGLRLLQGIHPGLSLRGSLLRFKAFRIKESVRFPFLTSQTIVPAKAKKGTDPFYRIESTCDARRLFSALATTTP